ncbi:MAG TPA: response regulator transcription factor [Candidatus Obscuribacterales bacterium]
MARLRIFLAINGGVLREGLRKVINDHPNMIVIGDGANADVCLEKIAELAPDITIITRLMDKNGVAEATKHLTKACPRTKVIVLSANADIESMRLVADAGARGYILKSIESEQLIDVINKVSAGAKCFPQTSNGRSASAFGDDSGDHHSTIDNGTGLSARETTVVRMVAEGYTNREIADKLRISVKSVETYRSRSVSKLGLNRRADLVRYALEKGWLRSRSQR